MLRAFNVISLPDAFATSTMFRCSEDRLFPLISIFKVPCNADSVNASEISVVFSHKGIFTWTGKNVSKELRVMAAKCVQDARDTIALNSGKGLIHVRSFEQGEEAQEFWKLLQIPSEPHDIPSLSVRFNDPILRQLKEPTAPLDLSSTTSHRINIAVIGGGATGVFCARQMLAPLYRQHLNLTVTLFEKSDSIGGMASKTGDFEAGCPFFTARSAEFKEFTRRSFESGFLQPLESNMGIGEAQEYAFRTFRFAAPSFESPEDQDYIYKNSTNPIFYPPECTVPYYFPEAFLLPADSLNQMRKDTDSRTGNQKPKPRPVVNPADFLFHEAHSLSKSMSAGNLWTGRLWRGHPSMADWFQSLLTDPRITIQLGTEVTNIERLQKRGGGTKVYGFTSDQKTEVFLGNFDYVAICTEFNISIKLTKNISKMMHLALAHSYQNGLNPANACDAFHQEMVVEFQPPLATALDVIWLESSHKEETNEFGLAFALKDTSRRRLFTTGVDRMRGHNDRIISMAKGYSYSTPKSHPVCGGSSSVGEADTLRDVWVLYSERGWNCLGSIGFNFVKLLNEFKFTLQNTISDQQLSLNRTTFFVKQCETQITRWQMLVQENAVRISELKDEVQKEYAAYQIQLETLLAKKETTLRLKNELREQLEILESKLSTAEGTKQQFEKSLEQFEKDLRRIDSEIVTLEFDLKVSQDSAARCRLDVLTQEDKNSAATQLFDREALIAHANETQVLSTFDPDRPFDDQKQQVVLDKHPAALALTRLDSNVSLEDPSFRNDEIATDDLDYLMDKSAKEAREKLEIDHNRREKEKLMQEELSHLLDLSIAAEQIVAAQTSKLVALQALSASNSTRVDEIRLALQALHIEIQNLSLSIEDTTIRLDTISQRLEFLGADEVALRVEIMQHKQERTRSIMNLQIEADVLSEKLVDAQHKHDMWMNRRDAANNSLALLQNYNDKTCDVELRFASEHKLHSSASAKQLCRDAIQVCEQSIFANMRECDGDTIVHSFGQRYIGLKSAELRKSKSKLLRYLADFGAENLLLPTEQTIQDIPSSVATEPEFVQRLHAIFLDLKKNYADFVLGKLVGNEEEIFAMDDSEPRLEEKKSTFVQVSGDKVQIDRSSDDFSPLSVLRLAAKLCKTCNLNSKQVVLELLASDFDAMFAVMKKYFDQYVSIINTKHEEEDEADERDSIDEQTQDPDDDDDEYDDFEQSQDEDGDGDGDDDGGSGSDKNAGGFFRDSDDDSEFMDELSVDRRKRKKLFDKMLASSEAKISLMQRQERRETSRIQSAASMCFDGSSLFDFHTKVCVCGNWLVDSSIEGAFLSGSGGAHRLMQSIEDDPVMLARLGEDALANSLYTENLQFRSQMQRNSEKNTTLRRMAQRSSSNFGPEQSLRNNFNNWRRIALQGKALSDICKRIKSHFINSCLFGAFSSWAKATDEQWALQFSAILQWARTLKSRAFVHWRVVVKKPPAGAHEKTLICLFGPSGYESEESEDIDVDGEEPNLQSQNLGEPTVAVIMRTAVPLHTDLSNLHDWCRCPLPPYSWSSEDEQYLTLPDISGSTDADLAKLAKDFLKDKPTKQSEYLFRLGWLLYWYRDNNQFTPKSLAAKMVLWEEKYLGLSPDISGQVWQLALDCIKTRDSPYQSQVLYFYKMCTLFPLCRRLSWRKDHVMTAVHADTLCCRFICSCADLAELWRNFQGPHAVSKAGSRCFC